MVSDHICVRLFSPQSLKLNGRASCCSLPTWAWILDPSPPLYIHCIHLEQEGGGVEEIGAVGRWRNDVLVRTRKSLSPSRARRSHHRRAQRTREREKKVANRLFLFEECVASITASRANGPKCFLPLQPRIAVIKLFPASRLMPHTTFIVYSLS